MPVLVVKSKEGILTFLIEEGKPLFIGRAEDCEVRLMSSAVSRKHAVILYKDGICGVKDLGSFNGTMLNDKVIQEPHKLTDQDTLKISSFVIKLYVKDPSPSALDLAVSSADATAPDLSALAKKELRPDSRNFPNSELLIPRAMRIPPAQTPARVSPPTANTAVFRPGKDTSAFMAHNAPAAPDLRSEATADSPSGTQHYFTPFTMPLIEPEHTTGSVTGITKASDSQRLGEPDLSYFQEPSLAPLDIIPNNADSGGSFVLDQVINAAEETPMPEEMLQSAAEAIIPLIEEVPLITTLEEDAAESSASPEEGGHLAGTPGMDTGTYTLASDSDEFSPVDPSEYRKAAPDTAEYQRASNPETGEYPVPMLEHDDFSGSDDVREIEEKEGDVQRLVADVGKIGSSKTSLRTKSHLEGVENIHISSSLMASINTRLSLYSLLYDLVEERRVFREENPALPLYVEEELARQDGELDNLPFADEADMMMQAMRKRRERKNAQQADGEGSSAPPPPSPEMCTAEELAISQWLLIRDSNREALPAIYKEAYRLMVDEPLVKELTQARISHGRLMGGAIYLLALQQLQQVALRERRRLAKAAKKLTEEGLEEDGGMLGMLGKMGKVANNLKNRAKIREELTKLQEEDKVNAIRAELAAREYAFIEKTLVHEFRQTYTQVSLRYVAGKSGEMPWFVRAFLRYGVIGFKSWWMREDVREFITGDCRDNVVADFERGAGDINILYADEYLTAISRMDITPSPDEKLEEQDKNSVEWKTDRAYRRIVNARSYNVLMEEMLTHHDVTIKYFETQELEYEKHIMAMRDRGPAPGSNLFDLQTEQQSLATRRANLKKQVERIKGEVVPSILEAVEEAEGRFRKGELKIPDAETLVRREVDALADIRRRMEAQKESFPPMVARESFHLNGDTVNSRGAVRAMIVEMENLDPGIFMNVIVPSKKKNNRIELRLSPTVVILPAYGLDCLCSVAREGMEGGHLVVPTCFSRPRMRWRLFGNMLADFRWNTSRNAAGRDLMNSDTLAGVFMKQRWNSRGWTKSRREKAFYYTDIGDANNWRRIYEVYLADAMSGARQLFLRNQELYDAIIGSYIDLPAGVKKLIK